MSLRLIILYCFLCSASQADDIYLKTGYAIRYVQVLNTASGQIRFVRDGHQYSLDTLEVLRVQLTKLLPGQKSSYELFSKDLYDQFVSRREQARVAQMQVKNDSISRNQQYLDSTFTWRKSVYLAGGWGIPQGGRFELGYNFGEILALALSFGIADNWSRDPAEGTLAILGSLRFPIPSSPITPFLLLCTGSTLTIFGGPDTYTLIYVGAMVELRSGIYLRPEFGLALTSKHISGGTSVFGGTSPEVKEDKTRFGANVALEIDLAHIFK